MNMNIPKNSSENIRQETVGCLFAISRLETYLDSDKAMVLDNTEASLSWAIEQTSSLDAFVGNVLSSPQEARAMERVRDAYDNLIPILDGKPWCAAYGTPELATYQEACRLAYNVLTDSSRNG